MFQKSKFDKYKEKYHEKLLSDPNPKIVLWFEALENFSNHWDLEALEAAYAFFIALFEPILEALQEGAHLSAADAFYIRTFMIHEYRKVVLRDPALPEDLLPAGWPGHAAYQLSRRLYRELVLSSERFIETALQNQSGALPPLSDSFAARFGGLQDILHGADA